MQTVTERSHHVAPGARPQPLALLDGKLWVGSWETEHIYALDPKTWAVLDDVAAPGRPYGLTAHGDELRVVVSIGEEDDRFLYRFVPGQGFDLSSKTPCPATNGSHLASDGSKLYLCQATNQRIVELGPDASIVREIPLATRVAGMGFGPDGFYIIAADEEFERLEFASLDIEESAPFPKLIAPMSDESRSLLFDGTAWWTCHREAGEIISFTVN